jgi:hypothetical protein
MTGLSDAVPDIRGYSTSSVISNVEQSFLNKLSNFRVDKIGVDVIDNEKDVVSNHLLHERRKFIKIWMTYFVIIFWLRNRSKKVQHLRRQLKNFARSKFLTHLLLAGQILMAYMTWFVNVRV